MSFLATFACADALQRQSVAYDVRQNLRAGRHTPFVAICVSRTSMGGLGQDNKTSCEREDHQDRCGNQCRPRHCNQKYASHVAHRPKP